MPSALTPPLRVRRDLDDQIRNGMPLRIVAHQIGHRKTRQVGHVARCREKRIERRNVDAFGETEHVCGAGQRRLTRKQHDEGREEGSNPAGRRETSRDGYALRLRQRRRCCGFAAGRSKRRVVVFVPAHRSVVKELEVFERVRIVFSGALQNIRTSRGSATCRESAVRKSLRSARCRAARAARTCPSSRASASR